MVAIHLGRALSRPAAHPQMDGALRLLGGMGGAGGRAERRNPTALLGGLESHGAAKVGMAQG